MSDYITKGSYIYQGLDELVSNAQNYSRAEQPIIYADEKIIQNNFVNSITVVHLPSATLVNNQSACYHPIPKESYSKDHDQPQSSLYNYDEHQAGVFTGIIPDVKVESDVPEYLQDALPNNQYYTQEEHQEPFALPFPTLHPEICTSHQLIDDLEQFGTNIPESTQRSNGSTTTSMTSRSSNSSHGFILGSIFTVMSFIYRWLFLAAELSD